MASPQMRMRSETPDHAAKRRPALRLLGAERSEEIFPVLLEEIVALGYPRASGRAGQFRDLGNHSCGLAELLQVFYPTVSKFALCSGKCTGSRSA